MTTEAYRKRKPCRVCNHRDEVWACVMNSRSTAPESTCDRYRPGCCENCSRYDGSICALTGEEKYELDVCTEYDPSGTL